MSTQEQLPPPPHQEEQPAASSSAITTTRPEPRDTVSTMQPTDPVVVKQEGNGPNPPSATIPEDSDMESAVQDPKEEHDADEENDEAEEDDEDNADEEADEEGDDDDEDEDEDEDEENERGTERDAIANRPKLMEGDEGDLTLSSDGDEEEELQPNDDEYSKLPEETVCRWKDCGKILPTIDTLVVHLSNEHIGWKKASYTCEWQGKHRLAL